MSNPPGSDDAYQAQRLSDSAACYFINSTSQEIAEIWITHQQGATSSGKLQDNLPLMYYFQRRGGSSIAAKEVIQLPNVYFNYSDDQTDQGTSNLNDWGVYFRHSKTNMLYGPKSSPMTTKSLYVEQPYGAAPADYGIVLELIETPMGFSLNVYQNGSASPEIFSLVRLQSSALLVAYKLSQPNTVRAAFDAIGASTEYPGDKVPIGVCISGGGSRAMTAGVGQLQALSLIQYNDKPLLDQVRILSSVSGGSWLSGPFTYLDQPTISDSQFLGTYASPQSLTPLIVGTKPADGNIGAVITNDNFAFKSLAVQMVLLVLDDAFGHGKFNNLSRMWQTIVGQHFLKPYGLLEEDRYSVPISTYSYSLQTIGGNADALDASFYPAVDDGFRGSRPFHVCNMAMQAIESSQAKNPKNSFAVLAQATPIFTGVPLTAAGIVNSSGLPVGGAQIATFAYNSIPCLHAGDSVPEYIHVKQASPWGLEDSIGVSSAFIAAAIAKYIGDRASDELADLLIERGADAARFLSSCLSKHTAEEIAKLTDEQFAHRLLRMTDEDLMASLPLTFQIVSLDDFKKERDIVLSISFGPIEQKILKWLLNKLLDEIMKILEKLAELIVPMYPYWTPANLPESSVTPKSYVTHYYDGGLLENTGLASLLSYTDIDTALVFVNTGSALSLCDGDSVTAGIVDSDGQIIDCTNVKVDDQISRLFGYQGYVPGSGYVLMPKTNPDKHLQWFEKQSAMTAQIFPSEDFAEVLQGLWQAATGGNVSQNGRYVLPKAPVLQHPAAYKQTLTTLANELFNVEGERTVEIYWFYLSPVASWSDLVPPDANTPSSDFPNIGTFTTQYSAEDYNLLVNLTAWSTQQFIGNNPLS
ncbi:hypothetical protein ED236_11690 [Pseudomethylobacillus aquaticus]|uniref:PLA2c domain-containing protein n=1 Tax=Pseudomethylobacillus aquaticus TaxID=2676064 RepID=A0A3N0UU13_9PROT|nr:hypothetical protein [Pseudomethylobacillus aquaticus]ROH84059.1 hypothetical protein ED236_11690 [Pseudomethylobacillus aquaticus]